ncbi:MAG: PAS domain-containing protein [Myxococcales bacterium]|nr:PAS domain-containing protein [Myxococcales bacterium]
MSAGEVDDLAAEVVALRAENAALRAENAANAASHEIFRVLFEHSSDAHLLFDEGGIIDCNNAAIEMLRCADKAEVLRLHPAVLSPERQPDGRLSTEKSVEMDRRARVAGFHRFEWVHRRMDGELFPVEVTLTPVRVGAGEALLVVWHDLTEFKAREAAMQAQIEMIQAQQAEIHRLMMPVIEVGEGVLMVPILGGIDGEALHELVGPVLEAIGANKARALVIDLTGLHDADAATSRHLVRLLAAARLIGATGYVSGVRAGVARALVEADVRLDGVTVLGSLREVLGRLSGR